MGFFSWKCGACKRPVLAQSAAGEDFPQAALVVVFLRNGSVIKGVYDGYGNVDGFCVVDIPEEDFRIAHSMCSAGQSFETLPPPEDDDAQGFFYSDEQLQAFFGGEPPAPAPEGPFQKRAQGWLTACFPPEIATDQEERGDRLLEEVLELLQSTGYRRDRVARLVKYVYDRPLGDPHQEVGGVMVTLAAFCYAIGLDMHEAGEVELARILKPEVMEKIRAKQATKPKGSPEPVPVAGSEEPSALPFPIGSVVRFKNEVCLDPEAPPDEYPEGGFTVRVGQKATVVEDDGMPSSWAIDLATHIPGLLGPWVFNVSPEDLELVESPVMR